MENIIVFGIGKYFNYKKNSLKKIYNVTAFLDNSIVRCKIKLQKVVNTLNM